MWTNQWTWASGKFPALTGYISDTGGLVGGTVGANFQTRCIRIRGRRRLAPDLCSQHWTTRCRCVTLGTAKLGTIGWPQSVPVLVTRLIVSYSMVRRAAPSPICKRARAVFRAARQRPDGQPARASNGPSPTTGRPRSSIFTSISERNWQLLDSSLRCRRGSTRSAQQRQSH